MNKVSHTSYHFVSLGSLPQDFHVLVSGQPICVPGWLDPDPAISAAHPGAKEGGEDGQYPLPIQALPCCHLAQERVRYSIDSIALVVALHSSTLMAQQQIASCHSSLQILLLLPLW